MYSDTIILHRSDGSVVQAERLPLGQTNGKNEAWLRDLLFNNPESIPVGDLDPSFGPLVPLCLELRTEAGPVDVAYINSDGLLTLVECKLWRNPEARRKVVAQVLDYARAIMQWSYADLQRQVSVATRITGNVPYELVRAQHPELEEHRFIDAVSRALRSGRFQLLVAGDGIREDVGAIAELINRNAASAFSFSMLEIALYGLEGSLAVQPRVIFKTVNVERLVVVVRNDAGEAAALVDCASPDDDDSEGSPASAERARWWLPLQGFRFDDPDQDPAKFSWPNNLSTSLPVKGLWISAYRTKVRGGACGVFLGGRAQVLRDTTRRLLEQNILLELPPGTVVGRDGLGLTISRPESDFLAVEDEHLWISQTLNTFVNVLRPRIKMMGREGVSRYS